MLRRIRDTTKRGELKSVGDTVTDPTDHINHKREEDYDLIENIFAEVMVIASFILIKVLGFVIVYFLGTGH